MVVGSDAACRIDPSVFNLPPTTQPPWWCRLNQEIRAPHLLVHGADRIWRHPTSRSFGYRVPDMCLTFLGPLHPVYYFCLDPGRYPPCRIYHLHTTRQANTILHTNKGNNVEPRKCPRFKLKSRQVNNSSHIKPSNWSLGFSISPLISILTIKSTKFELRIQDPMKHSYKTKSQKRSRMSSRRRKNRKANKRHKKR
jgi:hypothetical protein